MWTPPETSLLVCFLTETGGVTVVARDTTASTVWGDSACRSGINEEWLEKTGKSRWPAGFELCPQPQR